MLGFEEEDAVGPFRVGPIEPDPALRQAASLRSYDAPAVDNVKRVTIRPDDAGLERDSPAEGNACLGRVLVLLGRYVNPGQPGRPEVADAAGPLCSVEETGDELGRRRLDRHQPRAVEGGERKMAVAIGDHRAFESAAAPVLRVATPWLIRDAGTCDRPPEPASTTRPRRTRPFDKARLTSSTFAPGASLGAASGWGCSRIRGRGKPDPESSPAAPAAR